MVRRSESAAKRCGSHESVAMLAMTRGPSRKPACAATKRSAPSLSSAAMTKPWPTWTPPNRPVAGDALEQDRVHGLAARSVRRDVDEQVAEEDAAGGDGQRRGHEHHRALARSARAARASSGGRWRRPRCRCRCRRPSSRRARRAAARRPVRAACRSSLTLACTSRGHRADLGQRGRRCRRRAAMACVTTKRPKIGAIAVDRLLHAAEVHHREQREAGERERRACTGRQRGGRKLKIASAPEAIEMVIVST